MRQYLISACLKCYLEAKKRTLWAIKLLPVLQACPSQGSAFV